MSNINFADMINNFGYTMFNDVTVPNGINVELLINTILDKCALYEPVFTNIDYLTQKINLFFAKNYEVYKRLVEAFNAEYNPLNNYDSTEEVIDTNLTNRDSNNNDTQFISAYDSQDFSNDSKNSSIFNEQSNNTYKHNLRRYGNIGVTTSQQMLQSELDIRPKLNIYEVIANDFFNEFMIAIL